MTLATQLATSSVLHIKIQKTQVVAVGATYTCQKTVNAVVSSLTCSLKAEDTTTYTIEFVEYCSTGSTPCPIGTVLEFEVLTGF